MIKIIVLALVAITATDAFWVACPNRPNAIAPTSVESTSCSGNLCTVRRGEALLADASLIFTRAHSRLDVRVTAYVLGIPIVLPQSPPFDNACNSLYHEGSLSGCPTVPGVALVWRINLLLSTSYPSFTNSRVRFELLEGGNVEACADVTATLL